VWARLALTGGVELWLLVWLPGQQTTPPDHGVASGSFTVLQGELTEEYRYPGGPGALTRRGRGHRFRRRPGSQVIGAAGERAGCQCPRVYGAARTRLRIRQPR
jgi:hypothetical protein